MWDNNVAREVKTWNLWCFPSFQQVDECKEHCPISLALEDDGADLWAKKERRVGITYAD
jgi:hypothetical protein